VFEEKIELLNKIYGKLPDTLGCTGEGLCCMVQHPHCYYIEFVNMYNYISKNWSKEEIKNLHLSCVSNYLSNSTNKRCVFLSEEKKCRVYEVRDFNCRSFGCVPKMAYKKRVRAVKKKHKGVNLCLKSQSGCCKDLRPESYISESDLDALFYSIKDLDIDLGFSESEMNEASNYMTFHDHYLLYYFENNQDLLMKLTHVKMNYSDDEKAEFLKVMINKMGESDNE